jgi:hypothetical protein
MSAKKSFADELSEVLDELNSQDLAELSPEQILNLKKKINPYGRTIQGSDEYLNFSITEISHEYWKKFMVTSMVGFLNRMNDEWKVPDGVPVVSVYEYLDDVTTLDTPKIVLDKADPNALRDYEFNRKWMEKRLIVKEFLEEMFQFNPDEHVRSAYRPNRADKSRAAIDTPASKLAVDHLKKTDKEFKMKEDLYEKVNETKAIDTTTETKTQFKMKRKTVIDPKTEKPVTKMVKEPVFNELTVTDKIIDKDPTVKQTVTHMIPPADAFARFKIYYTNNYEELRESVENLYSEKPEFELAINPYAVHKTPEDAELFKKKHADEVISTVYTAQTGKWNFIGPFKEQRDSVNFYNKDTIILEEMVKELERGEKLGQDMMKKRVEKMKKKNIVESGPDADSFTKWKSQNSDIQTLAKTNNDEVSDDCPSDAVEVDIWRLAKGGLELTKEKIYTKAEAPEFVKDAQEKAMADGKMKPRPPKSKEKYDSTVPLIKNE